MNGHYAIAIDGPSGAGKSTLARRAAAEFGFLYVDTGAIYRTVGLAAHRDGIDCHDEEAVSAILPQLDIRMGYNEAGEQRMYLNGEDVSSAIRAPEISICASDVSSLPAVRAFLLEMQRKFARENNVVMDGRDIGTVVLPDAELKIFLTASPEARAARRLLDLKAKAHENDRSAGGTYVNVDLKQMGLGCVNSWGAIPRKEYLLPAGNYDFECIGALDTEQFNEDMSRLLKGETVEIPKFNFRTGTREYNGNYLKLEKNDILVIEGIHCLNDAMSYSLPAESKYKIYVSCLTQMNIDEHNRFPTSDARLLRRIVRDARTRGYDARSTLARWPSVNRRGEHVNIFPYQDSADAIFNSALIYETAVMKPYVEALLFGVPRGCHEYVEAKRLLKFLDYFLAVPSDIIPLTSICREFIGGGIYKV